MRSLLLGIFLLAALASHAQTASTTASIAPTSETTIKVATQPDAVKKLRRLKSSIRKRANELTFKNREKVVKLLTESTDDFTRIASGEHSEDDYLKSIDNSLAILTPLTRDPDDREEVAKYYQELIDAVGLKTSEGRLNAFVARPKAK